MRTMQHTRHVDMACILQISKECTFASIPCMSAKKKLRPKSSRVKCTHRPEHGGKFLRCHVVPGRDGSENDHGVKVDVVFVVLLVLVLVLVVIADDSISTCTSICFCLRHWRRRRLYYYRPCCPWWAFYPLPPPPLLGGHRGEGRGRSERAQALCRRRRRRRGRSAVMVGQMDSW